ncbi:MAG: hypothetical protein ACHQ53_08640 [Polyangiales bacterium]
MRVALLLACVWLACPACGSSTPATVSAGPAATGGAGSSNAKAAAQARYDGGSLVATLDGAVDAAKGSSGHDAATDASASGSSGDGAVSGFTLDANLSDAVSDDVLVQAAVCLLDMSSVCTMTDANGDFSIDGIGARRSGISASLTGYVTGLWPITPTGNVSGWTITLRKQARVTVLAQQLATTFGSSTGAMVFAAKDASGNPLAGVSVTVSSSGKVGYFAADGTKLDPALTATSAHGEGFVFDVAPGDVGVTFTLAGHTCVRNGSEGWPATGNETMTVPVQAGKLTRAAAVCQ